MERRALICPVCGAPHRRAVPSGVVQVKCIYCGAAIVVPADASRCPNHPDILATAVCNDCRSSYCRDCLSAYRLEDGILQLCSNCLARRHTKRAEAITLTGFLIALLGVFSTIFYPVIGILTIALFAAPLIVYGVHSLRRPYRQGLPLSGGYIAVNEEKPFRTTQEIHRDLLDEFVKSYGGVHGSIMLENRLKSYMKEGFSREAAIRQLAEDQGD